MLARSIAWATAVLIAAWILSMTLTPGTQLNSTNLVPFKQKRAALDCLRSPHCMQQRSSRLFLFVDVLGNLAVFVPFGAALALAILPERGHGAKRRRLLPRWWLAVVGSGFLLSLCIELAQLAIPTRATDVDDVILNTLGTFCGAAAIALIAQFRLKGKG